MYIVDTLPPLVLPCELVYVVVKTTVPIEKTCYTGFYPSLQTGTLGCKCSTHAEC